MQVCWRIRTRIDTWIGHPKYSGEQRLYAGVPNIHVIFDDASINFNIPIRHVRAVVLVSNFPHLNFAGFSVQHEKIFNFRGGSVMTKVDLKSWSARLHGRMKVDSLSIRQKIIVPWCRSIENPLAFQFSFGFRDRYAVEMSRSSCQLCA